MITKTILALLLCLLFSTIDAQKNNADIEATRAYYIKLKEDMKAASTAEYANFYVVKTEENTLRMSMPAVGEYYGQTEKWYITNEEDGQYGADGLLVYKKSTFIIAGRSEYREYVFQDGKLIFCYIKTDGTEVRYYYKNDKLIEFKDKSEGSDKYYEEKDWSYILETAKQ